MPKKSRKKTPGQRIVHGILYTCFLLIVLLAGTAAGWLHSSGVLWNAVVDRRTPQQVFDKDNLVVLVLGCDEDRAPGGKKITKAGARSDMMLLTRLDFTHKRITGVSIPRDTWVTVDGKGHKINAFHATGGNDLSKKAVQELLGVNIDRVVELDFKAFQDLVDLVGGVPINVEKNLKYTDRAGGLFINIKKGYQTLHGYDAMCFVRFRHSDSDFARNERQHQFVLALKKAIQKKPLVLSQVAQQAVKVLGSEFTDAEAAKLAGFAQSVDEKNIKLGSVPVMEQRGSTVLKLDDDKVEGVLREFSFLPPISEQAASTE